MSDQITNDEIDAHEVLMTFASGQPKTRGTVAWAIDVLDNADFFAPITDAVDEREESAARLMAGLRGIDADPDYPAHPETLADGRYRVTEFVRMPSREGELRFLAVASGVDDTRSPERGHAVWSCGFRAGKWTAFEGAYELDEPGARDELNRRAGTRRDDY